MTRKSHDFFPVKKRLQTINCTTFGLDKLNSLETFKPKATVVRSVRRWRQQRIVTANSSSGHDLYPGETAATRTPSRNWLPQRARVRDGSGKEAQTRWPPSQQGTTHRIIAVRIEYVSIQSELDRIRPVAKGTITRSLNHHLLNHSNVS